MSGFRFLLTGWLALSGLHATAQLSLQTPLADHMILQQGREICLNGAAKPGCIIQAELQGKNYKARTSASGVWELCVPPLSVTPIPFALTIWCAADTLRFTDLLAGDLWVCIGQSNMEWPMSKDALASGIHTQPADNSFRWYNPKYAGKGIFGSPFSDSVLQLLQEGPFYSGIWEKADSSTIPAMSAVAYYFGKKIRLETNTPVGLIHLAIGGAPLETFISARALKEDLSFSTKAEGAWLMNNQLPVWVRERGMQNLGKEPMRDAHPFKPSYAFENGLAAFTQLPVAGLICYQGESNAQETERVREYGRLQQLMVNDFRKRWKNKRLPYYFVQLSSIDSVKYRSQFWPEFRFQQYISSKTIPYSGKAVSSDHGALNDVHPREKKIIGERLALWALKQYYRIPVQAAGPEPVKAVYKEGFVSVYFNQNGAPLAESSAVKGFTADGKAVEQLQVKPYEVRFTWPEKPEFIYYGWKPFTDANLVNSSGLPCTTFRLKIK